MLYLMVKNFFTILHSIKICLSKPMASVEFYIVILQLVTSIRYKLAYILTLKNEMSRDRGFPSMWYFDMNRLSTSLLSLLFKLTGEKNSTRLLVIMSEI